MVEKFKPCAIKMEIDEKLDWFKYANKIYVDPVNLTDISNIKINSNLRKTLNKNGIETLFPIQEKVIDYIVKSNQETSYYNKICDICIQSPTGTGKTLCYMIPILDYIYRNSISTSVIITSTTILCHQLLRLFQKYSANIQISINISNEEIKRANHTIFILTPFRFNQLLETNKIGKINFMIFDEADSIFDHTKNMWNKSYLEYINNHHSIHSINDYFLAEKPLMLRMFLSATLGDNPEFISSMKLFKPIIFCYDSSSLKSHISLNSNLHETVMCCDNDYRPLVLAHVLKEYFSANKRSTSLVFVNSVEMVKKVSLMLKSLDGVFVGYLYSGMPIKMKTKYIDNLQKCKINVIVTTDALSRGLDIVTIGLIVNYEPPPNIQTYLHRVGRTCRGLKNGAAVTIVDNYQKETISSFLKEADRKENVHHVSLEIDKVKYLTRWYEKATSHQIKVDPTQ